MRFEETWPRRDVCHQCYVRADKIGTVFPHTCEICISPNLGTAESGTTTLADIKG